MIEDEKFLDVLRILRKEYINAVAEHPIFAGSDSQAVCIITEEVGELAKAVNEGNKEEEITEAAHAAVTAIRMMEMLLDKE